MTMTPIEALARASHPHNFDRPACQPDIEYALEKAANAFALLKASGFTIVSTVPIDADVERVAVAITDEFLCFSKKYWLRIAHAAITAYLRDK